MALNPKNYFKKRFNVKEWVGANNIKDNAEALKELVKNNESQESKDKKKQAKNMSFEEIIQANQWSASDILKNKKYQLKLCYGFLAFAAVLFVIMIVLFMMHNIFGGIFSIFFMLLGLAYAYQAWVGYEQLKQHKIRINVKKSLLALINKS